MKRLMQVWMLFFLVGSSLMAMDGEPDEQEPLCHTISLDDAEKYQQQFIAAIVAYQESLKKSLGCCLKKNCAELFKTDKYKHVHRRLDQLHRAQDSVRSCSSFPALARQVLFIAHETNGALSSSGTVFKQQCLNILQSVESILAEEQEEGMSCAICFSGRKIIISIPCMHRVWCGACQVKSANTIKNCIICRKKIESLLINDEPCTACHNNVVAHIGECGHPRLCDDCLAKDKPTSCGICGLAGIQWSKVY